MLTTLMTRGLTLLLLGFLISGCAASRGSFGDDSCASGERVAVNGSAAYAIYVDKDGNPVGTGAIRVAEDLRGTSANKMCPTPVETDDTGACPTGYCARVISGKTYCLRC
jgi:hypothetical protein